MRNYILAAATIIVLLGIGVGVYFIFFTGQASVSVGTPNNTGTLPVAGNNPIQGTSTAPQGTIEVPGQPEKVNGRLVKIDVGPVVLGAVAYTTASSSAQGSDTAVSYIERTSGNVFQYLVHAGTLTRTNNRTIPGIQEAKWLPDGSMVYVRYLSGDNHATINTYALPANSDASSATAGYFLAQNIDDMVISQGTLLTLASGANGSVGTSQKPDGSGTKRAFSTPLTSVRVAAGGKGQYVLSTKASVTLPGFAFLVNSAGQFSRIAGPLNGLSTLPSPSGKWVLISYTAQGSTKMALVETATNKLTQLPITTFADKCAWTTKEGLIFCGVPVNPSATFAYPDDWYQGAVSFNDRIWKIDVAGRFAELVLDFPKETGATLDATGLTLDPKDQVLVFRNKNDGSLWSYSL